MELIEAIRNDRATREFTDEEISKKTIKTLVDQARRAGSGHNRQPWTFIAIQQCKRLQALSMWGEYTTPLRKAPLGIVLAIKKTDDKTIRQNTVFDAGRAAQNLMLTASAHGLGTVPQGFSNVEQIENFLNIPADQRVLIGFAIGYPADDPKGTIEGVDKEEELAHTGRKSVAEVLHWERYR